MKWPITVIALLLHPDRLAGYHFRSSANIDNGSEPLSEFGYQMDWDDLRHFLAAARAGQILGAARRMGVSQSTLNRRISALEADLGTRLFERSTSGSALTEAGSRLLEHAERMEAEALRIRAGLAGPDTPLTGTVRIGAPDGFGVAFLAGRIGTFAARHPQLTVQIVPAARNFSLSRREADVAVTVGRPSKGRLRARKLTDYTLGLYASADYLARMSTPRTRDDLRHHTLIGYVDDLIFAPQLDFAVDLPVKWQSRIEVSGATGQLEVARAGAGIGILHRFMAEDDPALVQVLPEIALTRSYWAVWHESHHGSRRVRAVVDFLDEAVRDAKSRF
jgi:DNA-binding transcriptional LysR family regulator